jgi:iron complex outermembrane receptor protein/outer membrane receptor for ferrienterochelin and colicins
MKYFFLLLMFFSASYGYAQYSYKAVVQDSSSKEQVGNVSIIVKENGRGATSDANGRVVLKNLAAGKYTIEFSYTGYKPQEQVIELPDSTVHTILLVPDAQTLHDVVVVYSTRNNDRIENATTKVEVLGLEDMNEESTIKPGNIASILGDVSGVQIQQSSATTGNANVRIQGLDGRYTQILRDGVPLYGGYSGGFGILSIPPLDLRQIELIKGSSSTLYGGGAIGGLINLVSQRPSYTPDASFVVNQSTLKETNVNAYYAQRWKHIGFTLFAGQTFQQEVDVDKDGFSDVPDTKSTLIHPVLFLYPSEKTSISLGWAGSFDRRLGGDMVAVSGKQDAGHPYFEKNALDRHTFTLLSESRVDNTLTLTLKGSWSHFHRDETTNTYLFSGQQDNYYTEASAVKRAHQHTIVGGINVNGDRFVPSAATPVPIGRFSNNIVGVFAQDTWQVWPGAKLEAGLRADHHNSYGNFVLPRVALFYRLNEHWGARLGYGTGYIAPNPLTPQIRDYSIYQFQPLADGVVAEKSYAGNLEVNYKQEWEGGSLFINHAFFLTRIEDPIVATEEGSGNVTFANQSKPVLTKGFDTYVQLELHQWEFYLGYTYTDAVRKYLDQHSFMPVTPRQRAATTLVYTIEGKWRVGVEASYTGYQYREDYTKTRGYLFGAAMVERKLGPKWGLVLNCENLFDERQSRYESLYTGPVTNPTFKTLWAPIDGRVVNLSVRFQPFAK